MFGRTCLFLPLLITYQALDGRSRDAINALLLELMLQMPINVNSSKRVKDRRKRNYVWVLDKTNTQYKHIVQQARFRGPYNKLHNNLTSEMLK